MARKPKERLEGEVSYCIRHIPPELSEKFDAKIKSMGYTDRSPAFVRLMTEFVQGAPKDEESLMVNVIGREPGLAARVINFQKYHNAPLSTLLLQGVKMLIDAAEKQWGVRL